jgi:radical SAM family protein
MIGRLGPTALAEPVVRVRLSGREPASVRLAADVTVVAVDEVRVSSYDLCGRPYALVRDGTTWRRALDGHWLEKHFAPGQARVRRRTTAEGGTPAVESARHEAEAVLSAVEDEGALPPDIRKEALARLRRIVSTDERVLREDAARYKTVYRPVGILPPDQYLAVVVQITEGCSWNACTFCDFYRHTAFHVKTAEELSAHLGALRDYFGPSLALRRSVFLGDANALCVGHDRLLPLLEAVSRELTPRPLYAFLDAWTGGRKSVADYRAYARLGLRRVYVGLETGDPELLAWLDKPGSPEQAVELVSRLHEAGVAAGVIVLVGAGGERFFAPHARLTAEVLDQMRLGPGDILYFSELVEHPTLEYTRRAAEDGVTPLTAARRAEQRAAIAAGFRPADPLQPPRRATYDIREFIY